MRPEDEISIVIYSGKAQVILQPVTSKAEKIPGIIDNLRSEGGTNIEKGIQLAYKQAQKNFIDQGNNRIILATDGEFTISDEINNTVSEGAKEGIQLTIFVFGQQKKVMKELKKLSDSGNGNYVNITPENSDMKLIKEAQKKM